MPRTQSGRCDHCDSRQRYLESMGEGENPFFCARDDNGDSAKELQRIEAVCVDSAEQIAQLLADNGERGFEKLQRGNDNIVQRSKNNIGQEAIDRLAFLLPHRQQLYHGAKCIRESMTESDDESGVQDAALDDDYAYKPYADAVKGIIKLGRTATYKDAIEDQEKLIEKLDYKIWEWESDRTKAWCCRAALAAACVAHAHGAGSEKSTRMEAGVRAEGDLPTWRPKGSLGGGPPDSEAR